MEKKLISIVSTIVSKVNGLFVPYYGMIITLYTIIEHKENYILIPVSELC